MGASWEVYAREARALYYLRRDRDRLFETASHVFGEPAWDMLLLLFAADVGDDCVPADDLVICAGVSSGTARTYLTALITEGLATEEAQAGRVVMRMSQRGRAVMQQYFDDQRGRAA